MRPIWFFQIPSLLQTGICSWFGSETPGAKGQLQSGAMGVKRKESVIFNLAYMGAPKVPLVNSKNIVCIRVSYSCPAPGTPHILLPLLQVLLGIILLLGFTKGVDINDMSFTMVEYFSGKGNVAGMFKKDPNHRVATFELKDSKAMDMNSSAGFALLPMHVRTYYLLYTCTCVKYVCFTFSNILWYTKVSFAAGTAVSTWCLAFASAGLLILDTNFPGVFMANLYQCFWWPLQRICHFSISDDVKVGCDCFLERKWPSHQICMCCHFFLCAGWRSSC